MSLRDNLINLLNQSFFKTEEKPAKYMEWLISEYSNGKWYIGEEAPTGIVQELIETNTQLVDRVNSQIYVFRITLTLNNISDNQNIYCSINGDSRTMTKDNNSLSYTGAFNYATTYFDVILRIDPYIDENNNYWNGLSWEGRIEVT